MNEESETFESALIDVLTAQIMDKFDHELRAKIKEVIKSNDPKELRLFIKNLYRCF